MKILRIALTVPLLNDSAKAYSAREAVLTEESAGIKIVTHARPGHPARHLLAPWPVIRGVEYESPEPAAAPVVKPQATPQRPTPKGAGSKMRR